MTKGGLITVGRDAATAVQHVLRSAGAAIQLEKRDVALLVLVQDRLRRSGATELELGAIQELASVVAQAEGGRSISETAVRNDVSRMLDMRVLLRTGAPGVSRESFRLGPVGREIADGWRFVPDDEAERLDAVLGEANIMLAEAAARAEAIAAGSTEWTWRDVGLRVERIVADGMLRAVERRQSQLDRWQAVILLDTLGSDPGEVLGKLDSFLLSPGEDLTSYVEALDARLRAMVTDRRAMREYTSQHDSIRAVWAAAETVLRTAWATDLMAAADAEAAIRRAVEIRDDHQSALAMATEAAAEAQVGLDTVDRDLEEQRGRLGQAMDALSQRIGALSEGATTAARLGRLRAALRSIEAEQPIESKDALASLMAGFKDAEEEAAEHRRRLRAETSAMQMLIANATTGGVPTAVQDLADELVGRALAARDDLSELDADAALAAEARLGARRLAIEVDDPLVAAKALLKSGKGGSQDVWIAPKGAALPGKIVARDGPRVVIEEADGWLRVTTLPRDPILGEDNRLMLRLGRERDLRTLQEQEADALEAELAARQQSEQARLVALLWDDVPAARSWEDDEENDLQTQRDALIAAREAAEDYDPFDQEVLPAADRMLAADYLDARRLVAELEGRRRGMENSVTRRHSDVAARRQAAESAEAELEKIQARGVSIAALAVAWRQAAQEEASLGFILEAEDIDDLAALSDLEREQINRGFPAVLSELTAAFGGDRRMAEMAKAQGVDPKAAGHNLLIPNNRTPEAVVDLWRAVRRTCLAFVPADLAQSEDPMAAVATLSERVRNLEVRLVDAEDLYRQDIEGLMGRIRRAISENERRIERLNEGNGEIAFGDFRGIRLGLRRRKERIEEAEALLRLASTIRHATPEMGLAEAFVLADRERNRGRPRGVTIQDYLDYRDYVEVSIEVRRSGSDDWMPIEQSGASTGEGMGLGFTCLLMILASWEQEDIAERGGGGGTLRFLITDEAGRLDGKGLGTMAQLARENGACVVMAAPDDLNIWGRACIYTLARVGGETIHARVNQDAVIVGRVREANLPGAAA